MAKKVWISFPMTTSCDASDASVVTFLKGGQKKELEVETAAFLTKWLMDKDVPFRVDFDSSGVDRALVIESLPKRLQKALGANLTVIAEAVGVPQVEAVPQVAEPGAVEQVAVEEAGAVEQVAAFEEVPQVENSGAVEPVAKVEDVVAGLPAGDGGGNGPSELR